MPCYAWSILVANTQFEGAISDDDLDEVVTIVVAIGIVGTVETSVEGKGGILHVVDVAVEIGLG